MNETVLAYSLMCTTVILFGALLFFFAYLRFLKYKETLHMADKGFLAPYYEGNGKGTLRWGIIITGIGLALIIGLYPFGWLSSHNPYPLYFGPWMIIGLLPTFFGLSLVTIYLVLHRKDEKRATQDNELPDAREPDSESKTR